MIAQCDGDNIGSWRVMEKVGMKKISDDGIRYNKSEPNLAKTEFLYIIDL
jgi:RimJ/RimL family protein N-acetyltransferase